MSCFASIVDGVSHVFDAGGDGGEGDEAVGGRVGRGIENGSGDGGLTSTGRAPEKKRREAVALDGGAE